MEVIVQKVDMDTALTALLLGVSPRRGRTSFDQIVALRGEASAEELANPKVLCIEAGGSGQPHLNNFDHHNEGGHLPASCQQAFAARAEQWAGNTNIARLVDYVAALDIDPSRLGVTPSFPTLSSVFSGMLLCERNPITQLLKGIALFYLVLEKGIDPFGTMPDLPEWGAWIKAKRINQEAVALARKKAEYFQTNRGLLAAYLESDFIGGIGALYAEGCQVVIMYSPRFGEPPTPKYTVAGNGVCVYHLADILNGLEAGWGGRETIIGSPRIGSRLNSAVVRKVVQKEL